MASARTVKIITRQIQQVQRNPEPDWYACVDERDILTVYFVLRGPDDTEFEDGWYMGKFGMSRNFPMKAPDVYLFTPNGRFHVNKKICTTFTAYHPECWKPTWSISSLVRAMRSFFFDDPTREGRGIGALCRTADQRRKLATSSMDFNRNHHVYKEYFQDQLDTRVIEYESAKRKSSEKRERREDAKDEPAAKKHRVT